VKTIIACALAALAALAWPFDAHAADAPAAARPRIGLVLSGGGARGMAHIGVLKALEALRVPIDCIAGTSMGSVVGGAYALGLTPGELEARIRAVRWNELLADQPPRSARSARTKLLERLNIYSPEVGIRDGELVLPRGALYGQQIEFFLTALTSAASPPDDFDRMPIPFRAVATDIENGAMVVLARGNLAKAMRASMSVPAVFAPIEIDGRALLDGGLVRNLPVDVVRRMGAEIVIAVNLGTGLLKREEIASVIGVSQQMLNILTEQNVGVSIAQLGGRDVLVLPELGNFSAGDFDKGYQTIPAGEAAVRKAAPQLARLSLSEEAYARYQQERQSRRRSAPQIDEVRVDTAGLQRVNPKSVEARVRFEPGKAADALHLQSTLHMLYTTDDFQSIGYRVEEKASKRVLVIEPVEKDWGPNYFQFGMSLATDLRAGDSSFSLLAAHRATALNSYGLEWRNMLSIGRVTAVGSELYQPLDYERRWFIAPRVNLYQVRENFFFDETPVATYRVRSATVGLDLGRNFTNAGTARLGVERGEARADPSVALPFFPNARGDIGAVRAEWVYDKLDNWVFPTSGVYAFGEARASRKGLGADDDYERVAGGADVAVGSDRHRVTLGLRGGRAWGSQLPVYDQFALGGFLNLSGYQTRQFVGQRYALGRVVYAHKANLLGLSGTYLGGSLEAGNVYQRFNGPNTGGLRLSASVFAAYDSVVGPLALGAGLAEGGSYAIYLFLGRP